jgi:hypothetical protein
LSLTAKQEKFIQGIVSGLSQREAYKQAYNTNKMKNETIDNKAYILFKKDEVRARYNELLNEYKEEAKYSRLDMEADLIWIKDKAKEDINNPKKGLKQANGTVFINAIKELGELNDLYPAKKQDINVNGEINNPYSDLTTEDLKKLIQDD